MKRKRLTGEQIHAILKESESEFRTHELCRKYGISIDAFNNFQSKYAGLEVSELTKLYDLEDENRRLKGLVTELFLDNQVLKSKLLRN